MENAWWPLIQTLIGAAVGGVGAFVAVRERLARIEAHLDTARAAAAGAHKRIDDILQAATLTLRK